MTNLLNAPPKSAFRRKEGGVCFDCAGRKGRHCRVFALLRKGSDNSQIEATTEQMLIAAERLELKPSQVADNCPIQLDKFFQ